MYGRIQLKCLESSEISSTPLRSLSLERHEYKKHEMIHKSELYGLITKVYKDIKSYGSKFKEDWRKNKKRKKRKWKQWREEKWRKKEKKVKNREREEKKDISLPELDTGYSSSYTPGFITMKFVGRGTAIQVRQLRRSLALVRGSSRIVGCMRVPSSVVVIIN